MATTTLTTQSWERTLLSYAHEAWQTSVSSVHRAVADNVLLDRAYAECTSITAEHSRSFYMATSFLPPAKRKAIRALYAFCRLADDIVDDPASGTSLEARRRRLSAWKHQALSPELSSQDLVALAWADARLRYRIPLRYAEQLIEGVERDLVQKRYETFEDLAAYAYGVASTVGLMSMHIIGFSGPEALPYAIKLGVALQMTNILRDVAEDWDAGRVYLPAEELALFGLSESDLEAGRVDDRWRRFMDFQIHRNRRLYAEAWPGIAMLDRDGRLAVAAAGDLYRAILADIEVHDYDVFSRRAHVSGLGKLARLPGIWLRDH